MKKNVVIFILLACILSIGFTFTSCEDPEIIPVIVTKDGGLETEFDDLKSALDAIDTAGKYVVQIGLNQNLAPYNFNIANTEITIKAQDSAVTIQLSSAGSLFTVGNNVTLNLENGITLSGINNNTAALVTVNSGGKLSMSGNAGITGNKNTTTDGGGVAVAQTGGSFTMSGGTISDNSAHGDGGGVYIYNGTLTMSGGTISNNDASGKTSSGGGGVSNLGTFNMTGGTITSNKARFDGGGVYIDATATFNKSGNSIITGRENPSGNRVEDAAGDPVGNRGHAAYWLGSPNRRRENSAGAGINMSTNPPTGWDP